LFGTVLAAFLPVQAAGGTAQLAPGNRHPAGTLVLTKDVFYDASKDLDSIMEKVLTFTGPRLLKHFDMFSGAGNYLKQCKLRSEPAVSYFCLR